MPLPGLRNERASSSFRNPNTHMHPLSRAIILTPRRQGVDG